MPIKHYKPTTPGRRLASVDAFSDITAWKPEKSLLLPPRRRGGRNAQGKITVRHRGGGARRYVRIVDFRQDRYDAPAAVVSIQYDPGRGARIALLRYPDGEKRYIVAPLDLKVGGVVRSSRQAIPVKVGNRMPIEFIPVGIIVHNIELRTGQGGVLVRGAGVGAQIMAIEGDRAQIKLPSGEVRMVPKSCAATIGVVGNPDHFLVRYGKAGRKRHLGIRPSVRGKAMNPVDHPHGGGEGKHPIGMKHPKTPWGKPALGVKTRKPTKWSNALIVKRRK